MAAHVLVHAGMARADARAGRLGASRPGELAARVDAGLVSPFYSTESSYRVQEGRRESEARGPVLRRRRVGVLRRRVAALPGADFTPDPEIARGVGRALASSLRRARALLYRGRAAARRGGHDGRGSGRAAPQCALSRRRRRRWRRCRSRMSDAARASGSTRSACRSRSTSGAAAWPASLRRVRLRGRAKNDVATQRDRRRSLQRGLRSRRTPWSPGSDEWNGRYRRWSRSTVTSRRDPPAARTPVILAAGALATPHLLLARGSSGCNPGA